MKEISEVLRQSTEAQLWSVLDLLRVGVIFVGRDRRVLGMNVEAAAICRHADAICLDDSLRAVCENADAQLGVALNLNTMRVVRLPRGDGRQPIEACVLPLRGGRAAILMADGPVPGFKLSPEVFPPWWDRSPS